MPPSRSSAARHAGSLALLAAASILWTWPLVRHFSDQIPGTPGDNISFLWNLWWMRHVLSEHVSFFHSNFLFYPFGVDLVNHPHTALQGLVSATILGKLSVVQAENLYIVVSVFLNAAVAYALTYDITCNVLTALLAAMVFGDSPYIAAHLFGHFDLLSAWVIPLFALLLRRSLAGGRGERVAAAGCGICAALAAYTAYYYVVYLAILAAAYTVAASTESLDQTPRRLFERRGDGRQVFTLRLLAIAAVTIDLFIILWIVMTGGRSFSVGGAALSVTGLQNPLLALWVLLGVWALARWKMRLRVSRPSAEMVWRSTQTLAIAAAVFVVASLPLIVQAFRVALAGRYVSQTYFWRSAPRGIDLTSLITGNPFNPIVGAAVSRLYVAFGLNRIEQVGWVGVVPLFVLLTNRGLWLDGNEARRWKFVLACFLVWSLGPFLTIAGHDIGLPLPELLARFVPVVDNARVPGRAMVAVYLALGVLMGLRLSQTTRADAASRTPAFAWALVAIVMVDFLNAPMPLTSLERPTVYNELASITDESPVIEVPFGIGDGLTSGIGTQDRRILYYATIHQHPLVGGYIGRMPPGVADAYLSMPVVGNLLRLSSGGSSVDEDAPPAVPFRYLVLDTRTASAELSTYVHATLDMDRIASGEGRELYAVQGVKAGTVRVAR